MTALTHCTEAIQTLDTIDNDQLRPLLNQLKAQAELIRAQCHSTSEKIVDVRLHFEYSNFGIFFLDMTMTVYVVLHGYFEVVVVRPLARK